MTLHTQQGVLMRFLGLLAALFLAAPVMGEGVDPALKAKLTKTLAKVLPDTEITSITPSPLPGLYEVMLGATVLYMSADGRYTVRGDIIDLTNRTNVTEERRMEARIAGFSAQGPRTIEFAPESGKVKTTLYVFTDLDCGYCRKLHTQVPTLNAAGIAVRYLAFPRAGLKSESYDKAVAVWCAKDPRAALTAAKLGEKPAKASCPNPVASQYELGQAIGVQGTPAVYSENGEELGGYLPAAEIIKLLKEEALLKAEG
jgi:thiol:disulfide interchange protein DsbC